MLPLDFLFYLDHALVFLLSCAFILSLLLYRGRRGARLFLYAALYFACSIGIVLSIRGVEVHSPLTALLERFFQTSSLPRAFCYLGALVTLTLALFEYQRRPPSFFCAFALFFLLAWSTLLLMIESKSPFTSWLYILPNQCYTLALALGGLAYQRKRPPLAHDLIARRALRLTALFSVLIFAEDTVAAFCLDRVNTRNFCENLLLILYAGLFIKEAFPFIASALAPRPLEGLAAQGVQPPAPLAAVRPALEAEAAISETEPAIPETAEGVPETQESPFPGGDSLQTLAYAAALGLTQRESQVLTLLLANGSNRQICDQLHISLGTAKAHTHNIFQKAGVTNRAALLEAFQGWRASQNL